jgi:2-oxoisovalerate dehydrogenase E1 component subunit alpha
MEACTREVELAAEAYLARASEPATALFDHLYAELPSSLRAQRAALLEGQDQ